MKAKVLIIMLLCGIVFTSCHEESNPFHPCVPKEVFYILTVHDKDGNNLLSEDADTDFDPLCVSFSRYPVRHYVTAERHLISGGRQWPFYGAFLTKYPGYGSVIGYGKFFYTDIDLDIYVEYGDMKWIFNANFDYDSNRMYITKTTPDYEDIIVNMYRVKWLDD